ncbi:SEC-C domain-containing protein [Bacterioplanoides sp. SCSIO 12839]|nr:YchJ family metal-binding protein [Bacterioplanoides sp. SCSIO 12839]UTW47841.1 SEC-C domain-containing protein [Bacterioplanoides sp. SCSIO 12839]
MNPHDSSSCPCCSGAGYADCCLPFHRGKAAPSPEALMRSRYSAFALELADYLKQTWHPQTRPQDLTLEPNTQWLKLDVLNSTTTGEQGTVSFVATFKEKSEYLQLSETSDFVFDDGVWYYLDGNAQFETFKPGRNDPCLCGSGKKFKKCCG